MSKIRCICGHVIVDQTDDLPYKARVIADEDKELLYKDFFPFIEGLFQAKEQGILSEYLEQQFGPGYPKNLELQDFISDAFPYDVHSRLEYECEQCGRLWLQLPSDKSRCVSYVPESDERGVFKSSRRTRENKKHQ